MTDVNGFRLDQKAIDFWQSYKTTIEKQNLVWINRKYDIHIPQRSTTIKKLIRKGIPNNIRGKYWLFYSDAKLLLEDHKGVYFSLIGRLEASPHYEIIERDLYRTFPENEHFSSTGDKIASLRNVLVAFSLFKPDIGYCQGMNFIVAIMLLFLNEEETFWLLVALTERILPFDNYSPSMLGISIDQNVLLELLTKKCSKIAKHFKSHNIDASLITCKWFVTIFANVMPIETTLRIWDSLFYEGSKVLFRVAIAIFKKYQASILACKDSVDVFEKCKVLLKDEYDCDELLQHLKFQDFRVHLYKNPEKRIEKRFRQINRKIFNEFQCRNISKRLFIAYNLILMYQNKLRFYHPLFITEICDLILSNLLSIECLHLLNTAKFLRCNHYLWKKYVIGKLGLSKRLLYCKNIDYNEVEKFIDFYKFDRFDKILVEACAKGNFNLIKIINQIEYSNDIGFSTECIDYAAKNGHLDIVKYLYHNRNEGCSNNAIDMAACNGHLEIVRFLHENGSTCSEDAIDNASRMGHLEIVQFLHEHRTEGCTKFAMDWAAKNGHFEIVKFLHETGKDCTQDAMEWAALNGHFEICKFLHCYRSEGYTVNALNNAAMKGHLKIVMLMTENKLIESDDALKWAKRNGHQEIVIYLESK